jgi:hypothetical protein
LWLLVCGMKKTTEVVFEGTLACGLTTVQWQLKASSCSQLRDRLCEKFNDLKLTNQAECPLPFYLDGETELTQAYWPAFSDNYGEKKRLVNLATVERNANAAKSGDIVSTDTSLMGEGIRTTPILNTSNGCADFVCGLVTSPAADGSNTPAEPPPSAHEQGGHGTCSSPSCEDRALLCCPKCKSRW